MIKSYKTSLSGLTFSLILTACGGDSTLVTEDTCSIVNGSNSTSCENSVTEGSGANLVYTRQTLAAGEQLVLKHQLNTPMVNAQFIHSGNMYDLQDFSSMYSPDIFDSSVQVEPQSDTSPLDLGELSDTLRVYPTESGYQMVFAFEDNIKDQTEVQRLHVDSQGTVTDVQTIYTSPRGQDYRVEKLDNGHFLIIAGIDNTTANLIIVDQDANTISGPVAVTGDNANPDNNVTHIAESSDNHVVLCLVSESLNAETGLYDTSTQLIKYDLDLAQQNNSTLFSASVVNNPDLKCHLQRLASGQLVAMYETMDENENEPTNFSLINNDLSVAKNQVLTDTYMYQQFISQADNGNILIGFELGGPDAAAYAVLDSNGEFVKTTTVIDNLEPEDFAAFPFNDNSFSLIYSEDDSLGTRMLTIDANGYMLPEASLISPFHVVGYGNMRTTETDDSNSFMLFYEGYEASFAFTEVFKNRLTLTEDSDGEITLANQSHHEVEVVISVIGSSEN